MMTMLLARTRETYLSRFSSQAAGTLKIEQAMLARLDDFIKAKYGSTDTGLMADLGKSQGARLENNVLDILQQYANFMLDVKQISIRVVKNYVRRAKNYFNYILETKIHNEELQQHIKFPKEVKEDRYPLKLEEIHKILDQAGSRKGMYLFMIGAGMPIEETVRLRKRDFSFYQTRWMVKVPAAYRKVRKPKISFVSKEAESYFLERYHSIKDDDLMWGTNPNAKSAVSTEESHFYRVREKAGYGKMRYETSCHHKIGTHNFRAYFITKGSKVDHDLAHALCGHDSQRYQASYDRYELADLLGFYLKVEKHLAIYDREIEVQEELKVEVAELRKELEETKVNYAKQSYTNMVKINNSDIMASLKEEIIGQIKKDMIKEGIANYRKNTK